MLYALGTGFGMDPLDELELPFVFEERLQAIPTMATVIAWDRSWIARSGIDWPKVVHGDQRLVMHKPLRPEGTVVASARVTEVLDKGVGAVVRVETVIHDADSNEALCTVTTGFFARGDGGFDASPSKGPPFHALPKRAPDKSVVLRTHGNQALIYRLSGDRNPLHASPAVARTAGFRQPVLHGLCSYGMACRAVLKTYCAFDTSLLSELDVRFCAPLYPGETLQIDMWHDNATVSFSGRCLERKQLVLDNGRAQLTAPPR